MLHIWKARRAEAFANGWNETRRQLGILYARFYGALIVGMFLMYQFWVRTSVWIALVVCCVLIVCCRGPGRIARVFGVGLLLLGAPNHPLGTPRHA